MDIVHDHMGKNGFVWFHGVVEDTNDPLQIGRVRVRCLEFHTEDKDEIPTESLPWAVVLMPNTSASVSGKGVSPSGLLQGSWVIGFFRDGIAAQDPVILGTFHGIPQPYPLNDKLSITELGYNDPMGIYPNEEYRDESDVNRLARNDDSIEYTIVPAKQDVVLKDVPSAMGETKWSQPEPSYKSVYPHNKVMETESGHIVEFDDTKGSERIHVRHKSGTWFEIYPDGSMVTKVAGNETDINLLSHNSLVNGDQNSNINGSQRIRIGKDGLVEIVGDAKILVNGNTIMETKKDFIHKVGGNYSVAAGGKMLFVASRIDFNPEGVSPSSLKVNLPSSKQTVAQIEEIVPKNEEATPYQQEETQGTETTGISMGAVSGSQQLGIEEIASNPTTTNVSELTQGNEITSSMGGISQAASNQISTQSSQIQSMGTEVVSSQASLENVSVVQTTQATSTNSLLSTMGGVAVTAVAVGAIGAAVAGSMSQSSAPTTTTQYPQPISPVAVPAGSQPVQTNAPGIPTQSFYAIPGATATYIAGYPGVSGPSLSSQGSDIGTVTTIPAVPLVGFETEFPTQGIQIVDGGEF